jgi:hypothetical protein
VNWFRQVVTERARAVLRLGRRLGGGCVTVIEQASTGPTGVIIELEPRTRTSGKPYAGGERARPVEPALNVTLGANGGRNQSKARVTVQTRYRLSPLFEPAIELHAAEDTLAIGQVVLVGWPGQPARCTGRRGLCRTR